MVELTNDIRQNLGLGIAIAIGLGLALLPFDVIVAVTAVLVLTAVLVAIFVQPLFGLALALVASPFGALENVILGGNVPLDSGQVLLAVTFVAWLYRGLARRRIYIPQVRLLGPLALFTAVMSLTLFRAPSLTLGLTELLKWLEIIMVMLIVVDLAAEGEMNTSSRASNSRISKSIYLLLIIILLGGLSQALIGIWQFALRGHGPEHFLVLGRFYRAYGTFEQPNPFGGYMGLNGALAVGSFIGLLTLWSQRFYERDWSFVKSRGGGLFLLGFAAVSAFLMSTALIMSWSRGAWLGYAAGWGVMIFFWPKRQWQGVVLLLIGIFFLFGAWELDLMPASITGRLATVADEFRWGDVRGVDINDNNYAVLERLAFWQAAVEMVKENIWLGVGFGNYAAAYPDYALINWPTALGHAHNYYLNLLAEGGILGFTAYALVWIIVLWQNMVLLRRLTWPGRGIMLGLLGAWIVLAVHQLVDKLYVNNIYVHIGAMLGLQQYLSKSQKALVGEPHQV